MLQICAVADNALFFCTSLSDMATALPLEGDGLVENLFHYLWTTDDLGGGPRVSVPPTVIYHGSQPVAWYFTSRKSGRIKRKHRANLTAAHIEHSFTKRKAATDIVAYYLYLPKAENTSPAIEYFDADALREFLYKRPEIPHSSSPGSQPAAGILQHFTLPKGARNSTLRAIWSPKLCLLERRVNVHAVHDARFTVYERGVTFEEGGGAEALSRPEPVRGSMLPGMVQQLCERVVDHVTRVSYHKFRIARMVLRLQVDSDDRLWLLWSSSLRLQPPLAAITSDMPINEPSIRPLDIVSDAKVPLFAFAQGSGGGQVSLSSTMNPELDEEPRPGQTRCASCAQVVALRALLPTTYKAVLAHFQHVLKFLRERVNEEKQVAIEWPPDERVVQQAGGVGFGILRYLKTVNASDDTNLPSASSGMKAWQGREQLVPPVIRYMHPTLRPEDFARHRQDPIFLHKTVGVCERCCLVYADYATASLEANGLGIRTSASAPALLRPVRERPKHAEYFDDDPPHSLLLTTTSPGSPLTRGTRTTTKSKPPPSAWKPVSSDESQKSRAAKFKTGPRSTLHSLPMAPKLPPRIESFESEDNDALRIPDGVLSDSSPQQQQEREEAFFRELYQQNNAGKRGGYALRHMMEAADRLSKAKPQHRLAAIGNSTQIGKSQSTGALADAITELKLAKKPGKSPYSVVQRIRDGDGRSSLSKNQVTGNGSPARSPIIQESRHSKKKKSKKNQAKDDGNQEKTRFISSREKRAAAEHRGYLVAALSDAQLQLEHIESLATLIPAPAVEADPLEFEPEETQRHRKTKGDNDEQPSSPQVQNEENLELEDSEQREVAREVHEQEHNEMQRDEGERRSENGSNPTEDDKEEAGVEEIDNHIVEDETTTNTTAHQQILQDAEIPNGQENREEVENLELNTDTTVQLQVEKQLENEEPNLEHDQIEAQIQGQELEDERLGLEEAVLGQDEGQIPQEEPEFKHDQELEPDQAQEEIPPQQDGSSKLAAENMEKDEDDYDDEYEDPDQDQEDRDLKVEDPQQQTDKEDVVEAPEAEPSQNLLEQAQELLAKEASPESDEHQIAHDNDAFSDTNDQSPFTPLPPAFTAFEADLSEDAVIAADFVVAAALPLPSSDDSTSAVNDE
ncbi:hypothetical protein L914_07611 [Phytophthora nicotianae]|nr:hypothetical protein L914_07611 [Phytophthora nicotianae]